MEEEDHRSGKNLGGEEVGDVEGSTWAALAEEELATRKCRSGRWN